MSASFSTGSVRPAVVAGQFYPEDPAALRNLVQGYLEAAPEWAGSTVKAVIAPHAGYRFSGPIAGSAYACFLPDRIVVKRVLLLGPSHRIPFPGLATSDAASWSTSLGEIPLDRQACRLLQDLPQVRISDEAHHVEHSLEVQVPFLQVVFGKIHLVPLLVGEASATDVASVLECLWDGPSTRIVISSDLSHYFDSETAGRKDLETSEAIETLRPLQDTQACGCRPINGLLEAARTHGLRAHRLDLRNSGDTAGDRRRVVGYGAWAFTAS